jgi:nucleotide-binding universal stress UspA family protein
MAAQTGPIVIGFDGSPNSEAAVRDAGALLAERRALVVTVWKAGLGFELVALPATSIGLPPGPLDVRTALEVDQSLLEAAQRMAAHGTELARAAGFDAESLTVAEDPDIPIQETLARVAQEQGARALVAGAHHRNGLLGDITRGIVKLAPCPVFLGSARH